MRGETEEASLIDVSVHTTAENSGLGKECKMERGRERRIRQEISVRGLYSCVFSFRIFAAWSVKAAALKAAA